MKRCPTCNKTFTDNNLSFCIDDGTPLVDVNDPGYETTVVNPSSSSDGVPPYQPPRTYVPPGTAPGRKRKAWPWVVGILVIVLLLLVGLGIAAIVFVPRMMNEMANRNSNVSNSNSDTASRNNTNSNANTNANVANDNSNVSVDSETAPTDEAVVLSELTDLEQEWTVANINADKKKLAQILADDYVGKDAKGNSQGKADYLNQIERDTTIENWEFDDLKVSLNGNRATLDGVIHLEFKDDTNTTFRFTDKFVWRDGRWQATGSEVTRVK